MIKIATLNVKGLNNRPKAQNTLTLLKSYNLDVIMLQETNLKDSKTRNFLAQQWGFDSFWSSKTAILAGNKNIKFFDTKESYNGRVTSAKTEIKQQPFFFTNVYAPPSHEERYTFLQNWTPQSTEEHICIIGGDFNTNLNPHKNRISQAAIQSDQSRAKLEDLMTEFVDTALFSKESQFLTFYQNTQNNQSMATRLDYIFIEASHSYLCANTYTSFGNSDHLLVISELNTKQTKAPSTWKFNRSCWDNLELKEEIYNEIRNISSITDWDWHKCVI